MQNNTKRFLPLVVLVAVGFQPSAQSQQYAGQFQGSGARHSPKTSSLPPPMDPEQDAQSRTAPYLLRDPGRAPVSASVEAQIRLSQELLEEAADLFARGDRESARLRFDMALDAVLEGQGRTQWDKDRLRNQYRRLIETIYRYEVEGAVVESPKNEEILDKAPLDDIVDLTFPVEPGLRSKVVDQLSDTVSQLPLEVTDPVLSFINYFSSERGRKKIEAGFRRAGRYADMIYRILDEEGLPQELIYLAQAESAFLPRAVSRMAAGGMWQFIRSRGREYGLMQSPETDDRFDPEKATRAAARHLRDLYEQFGDWYLAIAAYNCGPGNVERAVQRTGYADFWELYRRNALPRETSNYLPIILALTIMAKNPAAYGLENIEPDPPLQYDTIQLGSRTHLALIADIAERPLAEIRELNPAVLRLTAPAGYQVRVPKGMGSFIMAALESIPAEKRASWRVHRVESNETVAGIAKRYNTTAKSILEANGADLVEPEEGDLLVIPVAYPGSPVAAAKNPAAPKRPARSTSAAKTAPTRRTTGKASPAAQRSVTQASAAKRKNSVNR